MIIKEFTYRLDQIDELAKLLMKQFNSKTILFYGEMGTGKTTLVRALSKALGCADVSNSPTFSIVNEYELLNDKLFHFDFYRIQSEEEAHDIGLEDYLYSDHWIFIEWPEKIIGLLPKYSNSIHLTTINHNTRSLKLTINKKSLTETYAIKQTKF